MAFVSITDLRAKQWDKSNLWDISIEDFNFGGAKFFPANDTELTFFGIENEQIGGTGLEMAKSRTVPNLTLSYIDDELLTVTKFMTDWQRSLVSSDGYYVTPLMLSSKSIFLSKLNSMKEVLYKWKLKGFPTGNIQYHGDSDGSVPIYSINFTITSGGLFWTDKEQTKNKL